MVVQFITADVINQINSQEEVDQSVEDLWNSALDQLAKHYESIKEKFTDNIINLIEKQDLFNSSIICRSIFDNDEYTFVISADGDEILYLSYDLCGQIVFEEFFGNGFSKNIPCVWLYDEFHLKEEYFEHHVIMSDGKSFVIPFKNFHMRKSDWFNS